MPAATERTAPAPAGHPKLTDLEIKDAQLIFTSLWRDLEAEVGRENLRFPKEIILLGGAPGAGKGTNTDFINEARGLTCPPIVMSALLDSPEARKLKDAGNMVGDREVVGLLLRELLKPDYRDGVIIDGFPRTKVQVECLKMLVDRMQALRTEFYHTPLSIHFRQPTIHIMVLFVDENTGAIDVQMDPTNPNKLLAAMWSLEIRTYGRKSGGPGGGIFMSTDGGTTWKKLQGNGLPKYDVGKIGLSISYSNPSRIYALIETADGVPQKDEPVDNGELWRSDDGGTNWKVVSYNRDLACRQAYYTRVTASTDTAVGTGRSRLNPCS